MFSLATLGSLAAILGVTAALKGRPIFWLIDLLEWLFERPARAIIAALMLVAALGWFNAYRIDVSRDSWRTAAGKERTAHLETQARVKAAAQGALDLAELNRATVEAKWQAQYQEALHANETLRDRNRALLAQWLRAQPGRTDPGGAGGADLPSAAALPGEAVHDAGFAVVPVADLTRAADAYAQLAALIGFVTSATAVETSPAAPEPVAD